MRKLLTDDEYKDRLDLTKVKVVDSYKSYQEPITHYCLVCKKNFINTPKNTIKGKGCKQCNKNTDYKIRLTKKNISVIPLGDYIHGNDKISHRCTCGKEWNIQPNLVLKNIKCGCNKGTRATLEKFNLKLEKLVDIEFVDIWKPNKPKFNFKCVCGGIWNTTIYNVLNGYTCGCGRIRTQYERYKDIPTFIYYIKINEVYKIGITYANNKTIEEAIKSRFKKDDIKIEILDYKLYTDGIEAYIEEQKIISSYSEFKYLGEKILKGGNTELFMKDIKVKL